MFKEILDTLQAVKQRPKMFIGKIDADAMSHFLVGFTQGCYLAMKRDICERHQDMLLQVYAQHGWRHRPSQNIRNLRASGLTDEEIIEMMVDIEIESWQKFL